MTNFLPLNDDSTLEDSSALISEFATLKQRGICLHSDRHLADEKEEQDDSVPVDARAQHSCSVMATCSIFSVTVGIAVCTTTTIMTSGVASASQPCRGSDAVMISSISPSLECNGPNKTK